MTPIAKLQAMVLLSNEKPGEPGSELRRRLIVEKQERVAMRNQMVGTLYRDIVMDEINQINQWLCT